MGDEVEHPETEQLTSTVDVPTQAAASVELAWSRDDDETETLRRPWRSAWIRAGLFVLAGIVAAVAVSAIGRDVLKPRNANPPQPTTTPSAAAPAPATISPPAAPPVISPPAAPTIPAAPPTEDPPTRSDDQRFLAMLASDGIPPPTSVSDVVAAAADVCRMIGRGDDFGYVESFMVPPHGPFTQDQAEKFVADAISAYCPHAAFPR